LARALSAGARWLVDVSNHGARVAAVVGVLIGVSVAGFLASRGLLAVVIVVIAAFAVAFAEGAFITWRESEEARAVIEREHQHEIRVLLGAMRNVLVELTYVASRIEEGPLGDELLPNVEWARHKDLIASERGDVFVELGRAYREADWLNRTRAAMETMDEEDLEYAVRQALQAISDAQDILGEWENDLLQAETAVFS
jgi:hypothetical protein